MTALRRCADPAAPPRMAGSRPARLSGRHRRSRAKAVPEHGQIDQAPGGSPTWRLNAVLNVCDRSRTPATSSSAMPPVRDRSFATAIARPEYTHRLTSPCAETLEEAERDSAACRARSATSRIARDRRACRRRRLPGDGPAHEADRASPSEARSEGFDKQASTRRPRMSERRILPSGLLADQAHQLGQAWNAANMDDPRQERHQQRSVRTLARIAAELPDIGGPSWRP